MFRIGSEHLPFYFGEKYFTVINSVLFVVLIKTVEKW